MQTESRRRDTKRLQSSQRLQHGSEADAIGAELENQEILRNARAAFFETCEIEREQLEDVYFVVAEAITEREMENV